jgi:hypothetical protein
MAPPGDFGEAREYYTSTARIKDNEPEQARPTLAEVMRAS